MYYQLIKKINIKINCKLNLFYMIIIEPLLRFCDTFMLIKNLFLTIVYENLYISNNK
jgi:hypothetical protein